jgi:hypothetical protein
VVLVDFLRTNADIFAFRGRSLSTPLTSYLTPAPCSNGYATLTKSDAGRSE